MIRIVLLDLIMLGLAMFSISVGLIYITDLVVKLKEVFPRKQHNPFEDEVYAPIEDYNDGFIEDEINYDTRISDMRAKLEEELKPEIITDEYEKQQEM